MEQTYSIHWMGLESADADAPGLLALIRGLADFEGWSEFVDISAEEIAERAKRPAPPFRAVLAQDATGALIGFATVFVTDFTYAKRPSLELEMLFVTEHWRRHGVGHALMDAVIAHARYGGYMEMEWNVLKTNARAQAFYRQFGADGQPEWDRWGLVL